MYYRDLIIIFYFEIILLFKFVANLKFSFNCIFTYTPIHTWYKAELLLHKQYIQYKICNAGAQRNCTSAPSDALKKQDLARKTNHNIKKSATFRVLQQVLFFYRTFF